MHTTASTTYSERVMSEWRPLPKVSSDTSPAPPTTRPTTPTSPSLARRLSSSSSKSASSSASTKSASSASSTKSASSSSSSNWRSGSPPRPICNQAGLPPFNQINEGDILYLPPTPVPSSSIIRQHRPQSNFEDHPLVVLGKRRKAGEEIIIFRQITSFGGQSLNEKKVECQRNLFMLVQNSKDMEITNSNPIAWMAMGEPLQKRSYVNLSRNSLFEIEYKYIEAFRGNGLRRLDAESVSFIKKAQSST